jgi:hypothetical protein
MKTLTRTAKGQEQLERLESEIRDGLTNIVSTFRVRFVQVGNALLQIETNLLFQPEYETLSEYAAARFNLEPSATTKFMNAARTIQTLEANAFSRLPDNERQTRELWPALKAETTHDEPRVQNLCDVWTECVKREDNGERLSAELIRSIVRPDEPEPVRPLWTMTIRCFEDGKVRITIPGGVDRERLLASAIRFINAEFPNWEIATNEG